MGRAERRRAERRQEKEDRAELKAAALRFQRDVQKDGSFESHYAKNNAAYMVQTIIARAKQREEWNKNGISQADLVKEYERGYKAASDDLAGFHQKMFYCAIALAAHRLFKFGGRRIIKLLDDVDQIMTEEICTCDIIERCKRETGVDINFKE